jgi:site-specific DNA-methyltransferase (adenine-specific)
MIDLHHIDCMEYMRGLPDKAFDIVVTSPPYNTLHQTGGADRIVSKKSMSKQAGGYATHSDDMPELDYQAWMNAMLHECLRVSKGLVWVNHKVRYRNGAGVHPVRFFNAPFYSEVIWDRCISMALNARKYAPSHEVIYGFGKPHFWDRCNDMLMSVWRIPPTPQGLDHPCPFPITLAERLILSSCPPDGTVFDPFAGSGTTGIAAINAGRSFVGCEIDGGYHKDAVKRLAHHQAQPRLFDAPQATGGEQLSMDHDALSK